MKINGKSTYNLKFTKYEAQTTKKYETFWNGCNI